MKRRDFLKMVAVAVAAPSLPMVQSCKDSMGATYRQLGVT